MPFHKVINPFSPTVWTGVVPCAARRRFAVSCTVLGCGAALRSSSKMIHFWSDSSLISVNLWLLAWVSAQLGVLLRQWRRVDFGTLKQRTASWIESISCFLIAWTASKSLPSCSIEFLEFLVRIGGMVDGWRNRTIGWVTCCGARNFGAKCLSVEVNWL